MKRRPFQRTWSFLLDVVELYIPMLAFTAMFVLFLINVFFRYVLRNPLAWPFELVIVTFIWLAVPAATYVRRTGGHVSFTLIYDTLSADKQRSSRIVANAVVVVSFAAATPATISWVQFMDFKATSNLGLSFSVVYLPIVPFLLLICAHSIVDIIRDIRARVPKER